MKLKLRRFGIIQTGKLLAVLYGFLSLLLLPFLLEQFTIEMP